MQRHRVAWPDSPHLPRTWTKPLLQTDWHTCHCDSDDCSLHMKEMWGCRDGGSWGLAFALLSKPLCEGWHERERSCLQNSACLDWNESRSEHGHCLINEKLFLLLSYLQAAFRDTWGIALTVMYHSIKWDHFLPVHDQLYGFLPCIKRREKVTASQVYPNFENKNKTNTSLLDIAWYLPRLFEIAGRT